MGIEDTPKEGGRSSEKAGIGKRPEDRERLPEGTILCGQTFFAAGGGETGEGFDITGRLFINCS